MIPRILHYVWVGGRPLPEAFVRGLFDAFTGVRRLSDPVEDFAGRIAQRGTDLGAAKINGHDVIDHQCLSAASIARFGGKTKDAASREVFNLTGNQRTPRH